MNKFKRRVIIIENDARFRELMGSMVEATESYLLINSHAECEDALRSMKNDYPDIIIMNLDFPRMKGTEAITEFRKIFPQTNILIVTDYQDEDTIFGVLGAGANGYVLKNGWLNNFAAYLNELNQGGSPLSPMVARMIVESMHISRISPLTNREGEVLKLDESVFNALDKYEKPKEIVFIPKFKETATGKIMRDESKGLVIEK